MLARRSKSLSSPACASGPGGGGRRPVRRPTSAGGGAVFSVSETVASVVNLPRDVERRKAVRRKVDALQLLLCIVPRAFQGVALVLATERGPDANVCRLRLTPKAGVILELTM